jgi:hypothetical protein
MKQDRILSLLLVCLFAFAGGAVSQPLMKIGVSLAADNGLERQVFRDQSGRGRLDIGVYNDQPMENLYGADGKLRIQIGTYTGDVNSGEKGLPVMTFSDNQGRLKMLLRIAGPNQSPVLVMKDNQERDRVLLGLSLGDSGEEPFLATFDRNGGKHMVFGDY